MKRISASILAAVFTLLCVMPARADVVYIEPEPAASNPVPTVLIVAVVVIAAAVLIRALRRRKR